MFLTKFIGSRGFQIVGAAIITYIQPIFILRNVADSDDIPSYIRLMNRISQQRGESRSKAVETPPTSLPALNFLVLPAPSGDKEPEKRPPHEDAVVGRAIGDVILGDGTFSATSRFLGFHLKDDEAYKIPSRELVDLQEWFHPPPGTKLNWTTPASLDQATKAPATMTAARRIHRFVSRS